MQLQEILTEKFFQSIFFTSRTGKVEVPIFKNPSKSEFTKLIRKNDVRGMIWKKDLYVWDAESLHVETIQKLEKEFKLKINFPSLNLLLFFRKKMSTLVSNAAENTDTFLEVEDLRNSKLKDFLDKNFSQSKIRSSQGGKNFNIFLGII